MDVSDLLIELCVCIDIPIIPTAALPEATGSLRISQMLQNRCVEFDPAAKDAFGEAQFEGFEYACDVPICWLTHEQMCVVGHQDPCVEGELVALTGAQELVYKCVSECVGA